MRQFLNQLVKNIVQIFSGVYLLWILLAIIVTYFLATSGFDQKYFAYFRNSFLYKASFSAAIVGGLLPIGLLLALIFIRNKTSLALAQAVIIGSVVSSFFKAFTGRIPPELGATGAFRFGILHGGIFFGWPSSHTTIAFAMALTLIYLFPKNKAIIVVFLLYALFIGFGVSVSIHWFSDFLAGAIIGTVIGIVVGKSFKSTI